MAASGSTILFAVSERVGRETILSTRPIPPGVPLRANLVGAAMRVNRAGAPQTPLWCRGDEPGCAPTANAVLAFGDPLGPSWVTFESDRALRLRERPPWTSAQPTHPLPLPPGFVPRAFSGASSVVCALASSGRVWCWLRLDLDPVTPDAARARGIEVSALSDADNEELVVGPSPRFDPPLLCARTRRGIARCVWLSEASPPDVPPLIASVAEIHGWIEPVVGLALSTHELCATSADGRVACAVGPDRTDAFALSDGMTLRPEAELHGAAQLAVDMGVVGFEVTGLARHGWLVKPGLEFVVVQALGQCPVHAGHARVAGYLADSGFGDAESGTDLTGAQDPAVQQLQCVS